MSTVPTTVNGYPVIAYKITRDGHAVLCRRDGEFSDFEPFAVWNVNKDGHAFSGGYYSTPDEAHQDLASRR
jgi:hypothetical protein